MKPPEKEAFLKVRITPEYKLWLNRFAEKRRLTVSQLVDQAIVAMARSKRFESPPTR
jgi:hypothetical protein